MTPRHRLALLALAALLPLAACSSDDSSSPATTAAATTAAATAVAPAKAGAVLLAPTDAQAFLAAHPEAVLLDVRTPEEFAAGHLAGAQLLDLRSGQLEAALPSLDKAATYVVYCHSGNRSAQATALMEAAGFGSVYEVAGGIQAWQAADLPVKA